MMKYSCGNCQHFVPRETPFEWHGSCEVALPKWLFDRLDFNDWRAVRSDDFCDLHKPQDNV